MDLIDPNERALRHSVRSHAGPGLDGRGAYETLAEFYLLRAEPLGSTTLTDVLDRIGARYPGPEDAAALKLAIIAKNAPLARTLFPDASEAVLLRALACTRAGGAFDLEQLGLEDRCHALWQEDRPSAANLVSHLLGNDHNANGERILLALLRGMTVDDAVELSASIPALVSTLVGLNPAAAASPIVWNGPADRQRDLFDAAIGGREVPEEVQRGVVLAMLQAKSDAVADRAVRRFGSTAVVTVLCWFDESGFGSPADLSRGWRRAISERPSSLLDWMAASPSPREASAALVADLLNPHSTEVNSRGAGLWVGPTSAARGVLPEADRIRFHVFLLAFGFDNPSGPADELVVRSFATVHQALADGVLRYDSWRYSRTNSPGSPGRRTGTSANVCGGALRRASR